MESPRHGQAERPPPMGRSAFGWISHAQFEGEFSQNGFVAKSKLVKLVSSPSPNKVPSLKTTLPRIRATCHTKAGVFLRLLKGRSANGGSPCGTGCSKGGLTQAETRWRSEQTFGPGWHFAREENPSDACNPLLLRTVLGHLSTRMQLGPPVERLE